MEVTNLNILLPAFAGILFFIQSCYLLGLYRKLYIQSNKPKRNEADTPPLSVIIVAKDATSELQKNLPVILEQDYPDYEVIVIYDRSTKDECENLLKLLQNKYSHLYYTFIPDSARYISHKKLGVTMGIKASRHEWLVFTEPDCRPSSKQWLQKLAENFTDDTDIVLGYSNYEKCKGWFNRKITFDTLLRSMRYLGMAANGYPYMGCGRNFAYRKSLYYKHKGFTSHLTLQRGEDDLFVNQVAHGKNTRVEVSSESVVRISTPSNKKSWREEKLSYTLTSRHFKGIGRYLMGFETCSRLLFLISTTICLIYGILIQGWIMTTIAIVLWSIRFMIQAIIFHKTSIALNERKFCLTLPLFDWIQPLWNLKFKLQQRFRNKNEFMRK